MGIMGLVGTESVGFKWCTKGWYTKLKAAGGLDSTGAQEHHLLGFVILLIFNIKETVITTISYTFQFGSLSFWSLYPSEIIYCSIIMNKKFCQTVKSSVKKDSTLNEKLWTKYFWSFVQYRYNHIWKEISHHNLKKGCCLLRL